MLVMRESLTYDGVPVLLSLYCPVNYLADKQITHLDILSSRGVILLFVPPTICINRIASEWAQNGHRMGIEEPQNGHRMGTEWPQNGHRIASEWPQNGQRRASELSWMSFRLRVNPVSFDFARCELGHSFTPRIRLDKQM